MQQLSCLFTNYRLWKDSKNDRTCLCVWECCFFPASAKPKSDSWNVCMWLHHSETFVSFPLTHNILAVGSSIVDESKFHSYFSGRKFLFFLFIFYQFPSKLWFITSCCVPGRRCAYVVWIRYCLPFSLQELLSLFTSRQSAVQEQVLKTRHLLSQLRCSNPRRPSRSRSLFLFSACCIYLNWFQAVLPTYLFPAAERPLITAHWLISKQGLFISMDVFTRSQNNSDWKPFMQKAQQTRQFAFEMRWQPVALLQDRLNCLLSLHVSSKEQQNAVCTQSKVFCSELQMYCPWTLYDKHGAHLKR